jgi:hypothetical protein
MNTERAPPPPKIPILSPPSNIPIFPPNILLPDRAAGAVSADSTDMLSPRDPPDHGGKEGTLTPVTDDIGEGAVPDPKEKTEFTEGKFVIPSIRLPTPSTSALRTSTPSG